MELSCDYKTGVGNINNQDSSRFCVICCYIAFLVVYLVVFMKLLVGYYSYGELVVLMVVLVIIGCVLGYIGCVLVIW